MQQTVASTVLGQTPLAHAPSLERMLDLARLQVPVGYHMPPLHDIARANAAVQEWCKRPAFFRPDRSVPGETKHMQKREQ